MREAVNKFVERGINWKQTLITLVSFESFFFHMHILAILGVLDLIRLFKTVIKGLYK